MMRWWGPSGAVSVAETDVRVGGRFRVVFRTDDAEQHEVSGTYREIVPAARLVFSWAWRSTPERELQVSLTFDKQGGGTLLTLTHERFFDEAARDGHRAGWTKSLGRLERLFA